MNPLFNVAAAFALGAATAYLLGGAIMRRRVAPVRSDAQLCEWVRSRLPKLVSYPGAVEVGVESGILRVSGRVLSRELDGLLMRLTEIPGVYKVHNALATLDDPTSLDEIQSGGRRGGVQA